MTLQTVDLVLTRLCNLRCRFCYLHAKTSTSDPGEVERNLKICGLILKQFREGHLKHNFLNINLYGGEPLCAWDSVKAINEWRGEFQDVNVNLSLVTNMSLLDEDKMNYCIVNRIGIHPSIDGCKEVEDMFRITRDGKTVSDQVYENARRLTKKLKGRSCRSTICPETVPYMLKSVKFICEDLGFDINNQVLAGGVKWTDEDIEGIKAQTRLISDWWMDKMRAGKHYSLYYLRNMLAGIWNPIRNRRLCGAGCAHGSIDTDGTIFPCHRFNGPETPKEYVMGNIFNGGVTNVDLEKKIMGHDVALYLKDKCSTCIAVNSCHALCLHEMMLNGSMFEPLDHYCKIWPFYYQEAMRVHSIMVAERNPLYLSTYKPRPPTQSSAKGK